MDRLLSVKDIQERYKCTPATARRYIREMNHMEHPLMVREMDLLKWEELRMVPPVDEIRRAINERYHKHGA